MNIVVYLKPFTQAVNWKMKVQKINPKKLNTRNQTKRRYIQRIMNKKFTMKMHQS